MQAGGRIGGVLANYQMVWVDRAGVATPVDTAWTFNLTQSGANVGWALSPDGSRLAIGLNTGSGDDIWIKQLPTGPLSRLTLDSIPEQSSAMDSRLDNPSPTSSTPRRCMSSASAGPTEPAPMRRAWT